MAGIFGAKFGGYTSSDRGAWEEKGWPFNAGDPELHKYRHMLIVQGGRVLDLGSGYGRSSMMFAVSGMSVLAMDERDDCVETLNGLAFAYGLPIKARLEDVRKAEIPQDAIDMVLLSNTFNHFSSKKEALEVLGKAVRALRDGGYIWIRAIGKEDEAFDQFSEAAEKGWGVKKVDGDVFMANCGCSGMMQMEPHLFFDQLELLKFLLGKGTKIVHSEVGSRRGQRNIMFGEDFPRMDVDKTGMVSVLAQKI